MNAQSTEINEAIRERIPQYGAECRGILLKLVEGILDLDPLDPESEKKAEISTQKAVVDVMRLGAIVAIETIKASGFAIVKKEDQQNESND